MASHRQLAEDWQTWMQENGPRLVLFARQRCDSLHDAEDMVQEAIVRLWGYQEERGYVPPDLPLAYSVLRYITLDNGRKTKRRIKRDEKIISLSHGQDIWFDSTLEDDEDAEILRQAVKELKDKLREVITLKVWGGLTFAEIGKTLSISNNTAASRYRYALEQLQENLKSLKESRHG